MVDVHSPVQRAANMRAVRQKNTNPELQVRRLLFASGFRFRVHVRSLPGSPDIVLAKHKVVVFVHGCFWHGHGCYLFKVPSTRTDFWLSKIQGNRDRDYRDITILLNAGWRVLTVWECALKGKNRRPASEVVEQIAQWILAADPTVPRLDVRHR